MSRLLSEPVDRREDHFQGGFGAAITLLEYGDYASPASAEVRPVVERVIEGVGRELRYVYRHFPAGDERARLAAQAAEAAGAQGRFWEMHERLFAARGALELPDLVEHARELGLDAERFESDLRSGRYAEKVERDAESAVRSGVERVPAFFLDGERYGGAVDSDTLIDELLDAAYE